MERWMNRLSRQSFLGPRSDAILDGANVGIVGLGGGGSHVVQQLAHMGVGGYVLADPDRIDYTNTNRLVGGTLADVQKRASKVSIAERAIRSLKPDARIVSVVGSWTVATEQFKTCDVIVGALDSFKESNNSNDSLGDI
jgi:molybdopterin/thiamine biosynthesis adenylyltransferase